MPHKELPQHLQAFSTSDFKVSPVDGCPKAFVICCRQHFRNPYKKGLDGRYVKNSEAPPAKDYDGIFRKLNITEEVERNLEKHHDVLWASLDSLRGFKNDIIRVDKYGNVLHRYAGHTVDRMAWQVDHVFPVNLGGLSVLPNLRIIQWRANQAKKDKLEFLIPPWELAAGIAVPEFLKAFASRGLSQKSRVMSSYFIELAEGGDSAKREWRSSGALPKKAVDAVLYSMQPSSEAPPTPGGEKGRKDTVKWSREEKEAITRLHIELFRKEGYLPGQYVPFEKGDRYLSVKELEEAKTKEPVLDRRDAKSCRDQWRLLHGDKKPGDRKHKDSENQFPVTDDGPPACNQHLSASSRRAFGTALQEVGSNGGTGCSQLLCATGCHLAASGKPDCQLVTQEVAHSREKEALLKGKSCLEAESAKLELRLQQRQQESCQLAAEVAELNSQKDALLQLSREAEGHYSEQVEILRTRQAEVHRVEAQNEEVQEKLRTAEAQITGLSGRLRCLALESAALGRSLHEVEGDRDALEKAVRDAEVAREMKEKELEQARVGRRCLEEEVLLERARYNELEGALYEEVARRERAEDELAKRRHKRERAELRLQEARLEAKGRCPAAAEDMTSLCTDSAEGHSAGRLPKQDFTLSTAAEPEEVDPVASEAPLAFTEALSPGGSTDGIRADKRPHQDLYRCVTKGTGEAEGSSDCAVKSKSSADDLGQQMQGHKQPSVEPIGDSLSGFVSTCTNQRALKAHEEGCSASETGLLVLRFSSGDAGVDEGDATELIEGYDETDGEEVSWHNGVLVGDIAS